MLCNVEKKRVLANCPRCDAPNDHLVHILTCLNREVQTIITDQLLELEVWLTQEDTYPALIPILVESLRSWIENPYGDEPNFQWPSDIVHATITAQQQQGWYAFLVGFISSPIVTLQNSYSSTIQSRKRELLGHSTLFINAGTLSNISGCITIRSCTNRRPYLGSQD